MRPSVSVVTLGVGDFQRALRFLRVPNIMAAGSRWSLAASRTRREEEGVAALPATSTTSNAVRCCGSAQPGGLRRQRAISGVASSRRTALAGTPSSSRLGDRRWRSQRDLVSVMLGTLGTG